MSNLLWHDIFNVKRKTEDRLTGDIMKTAQEDSQIPANDGHLDDFLPHSPQRN